MWWVAPVWRSAPAESFDGTAWAVGGPIFMGIAMSGPVGLLLLVVGLMLYAKAEKKDTLYLVLVVVLIAAIMMYPPTMDYYPVLFGMLGGVITLSFFAIMWIWANRRQNLEGVAKSAAVERSWDFAQTRNSSQVTMSPSMASVKNRREWVQLPLTMSQSSPP